MTILVNGQDNHIIVDINSTDSLSGMELVLSIATIEKTHAVEDVKNDICLSTAEVETIGMGQKNGILSLLDSAQKEISRLYIEFNVVDSTYAYQAYGNQEVVIGIPADPIEEGGGGGSEYLRKSDFANLENPEASVKSINQWAIEAGNILRGDST